MWGGHIIVSDDTVDPSPILYSELISSFPHCSSLLIVVSFLSYNGLVLFFVKHRIPIVGVLRIAFPVFYTYTYSAMLSIRITRLLVSRHRLEESGLPCSYTNPNVIIRASFIAAVGLGILLLVKYLVGSFFYFLYVSVYAFLTLSSDIYATWNVSDYRRHFNEECDDPQQ